MRIGAGTVVAILAALLAGVALLVVVLAGPAGGPSAAPAFSWFHATPADAGWRRAVTTDGAVLRFPPSLHPVTADPGAVSVEREAGGLVSVYLDVTPWEGGPPPGRWAAARVDRLGDEDEAVHEDGAADGLRFRAGATGSCVEDHYVTRVGRHRYHEMACLVRAAGPHAPAVVVVAAASGADWPAARPLLRRALEAVTA